MTFTLILWLTFYLAIVQEFVLLDFLKWIFSKTFNFYVMIWNGMKFTLIHFEKNSSITPNGFRLLDELASRKVIYSIHDKLEQSVGLHTHKHTQTIPELYTRVATRHPMKMNWLLMNRQRLVCWMWKERGREKSKELASLFLTCLLYSLCSPFSVDFIPINLITQLILLCVFVQQIDGVCVNYTQNIIHLVRK